MTTVLNFGVAIGSLLAALLWFLSAAIPRLPQKMTVGWGGVGGTQDGLLDAFKKQTYLSKAAAVAAGVAALCQGLPVVLNLLFAG